MQYGDDDHHKSPTVKSNLAQTKADGILLSPRDTTIKERDEKETNEVNKLPQQQVADSTNQSKDSDEPFVPKWLIAIKQSKKENELRKKREQQARVARLQKLFDDAEDDYGVTDALDKHAVERKMQDYLGKIDTHLRVEL